MNDRARRRVPRMAAFFGAGIVLVVTGVAEFIRLIEPGATVDIRVLRGLLFLVVGLGLTIKAHIMLRHHERTGGEPPADRRGP